jgi:MoaA/NifB/PqqE/SkfB family radical SAM enzyme
LSEVAERSSAPDQTQVPQRAPRRVPAPLPVRRFVARRRPLRRLARRFGYGLPSAPSRPPLRPAGVKLELTYRCNLKCAFCYTDSPQRTRERPQDLSDEAWRRVVDEALELGIIEAVVSGGEPLLRRELALDLTERLVAGGAGVAMVTNGWFVDEAVADRLAALDGVHVNVSIDGATPELHDRARGVPGSWDRAIRAIDLLLSRGGNVHVNHVVTPDNAPWVAQLLDEMLTLGVRTVRIAPVVPVGGAARDGEWAVDRRSIQRTVDGFMGLHGHEAQARLQPVALDTIAGLEDRPPASLLVRPNGSIWMNSLEPFSFGNALDTSLEECWDEVAKGWWDARIQAWAGSIRRVDDFAKAGPVAYRDPETPIAPTAQPEPERPTTNGKRSRRAQDAVDGAGDLAGALGRVRELALSRGNTLRDVRWVSEPDGGRYVRVLGSGRICRLNSTAALVMDARSGADAVALLAERTRAIDRVRLEDDTLAAIRMLLDRGVVEPAPA